MVLDEDACCSGDLGLILDKTVKLEWHRTNNMRIRCLRITQKVSLTLLCLLYFLPCYSDAEVPINIV